MTKTKTRKRFENRNVTSTSKWMPCPKHETDYPGLAYIDPLSELIVVKQTDTLHDAIGTKGTGYTIFNNQGQKVFLAIQEKHYKRFDLKIFNFYGNEVIQVKKPFKCCLNRVVVWAPPGHCVGSVKNIAKIRKCDNTFLVENSEGQVIMNIKPDKCSNVFKIRLNDEDIGIVNNKWSTMDNFNVNHFGLTFPVDMDMENKIVLLGACFLIGFLNY